MKKILFYTLVLSMIVLQSCKDSKETNKQESIDDPLTELSVYNLPSKWTNQNGENIELKDFRGNVLVVVMIYTECKAACPRLVADMRLIRERVVAKNKDKVKYLLVSIDPEADTPEKLKEFTIDNKMDDDQWVFLRSNEEDTREFAATLAVNYKRISPIDFSHSNIISVFNTEGELVFQKEGFDVNYDAIVGKITEEVDNIK